MHIELYLKQVKDVSFKNVFMLKFKSFISHIYIKDKNLKVFEGLKENGPQREWHY